MLCELLDKKQKINADVHNDQLSKLAAVLLKKRSKPLNITLLQNNARPLNAKSTRDILEKLNCTISTVQP
ncbi:hypothetical protein KIN20_013457 [Parelaphostrongylus tenuis]|uniref:Uncharacterized protein n=1 Tax=Parelaphostrongylus tenuis TaxID=148309 RepID=A0AAD5N235_PARTN|nr:hypothetical protein KIN20_013457 [Parelaphostrongylus tenuis]